MTSKMKATAGSEIFFVFASFFLKTVHAIVKRNSHARRQKSFLLVLDRISVLFPSCARRYICVMYVHMYVDVYFIVVVVRLCLVTF